MAYQAITWSALRQRLQDKTEQKIFWDATEARDAVNESLLLWNLLTAQWRTTVSIPTVAGQYDYVLPSSLLYRTRFLVDGLPLSSSSREELNLGRPYWRRETTASGGDVPARPMLFAPISLQLIYLWPADAVGGRTLTVEGIAATPVLVEDGDTLDLGSEEEAILLGMALHILSLKKGGEAFAITQPLFQAFLKDAAQQNDRIRASTIYRTIMGLDRRDLKRTSVPQQTAGQQAAG
jgi:hypothetical protein